jgi:hypothetical protein
MDLLAYQRAFMRMSFAAEPNEHDLSAVGEREQALLYRHMIRTRLVGMAKVAFKATLGVVGEDAFARCFARYLAAMPPQSALIRDVIAEFGPFARGDLELALGAPPYLVDLLYFEEHKWRLAYLWAPALEQAALRELDFAGLPRWNPVFRCLSLAHPVHDFASKAQGCAADPCELFIYRPAGSDQVRWYKADPFFAALARRSLANPRASFGELIPGLSEERGVTVDQALLESLATSLTLAIERAVLLGVLDRS